MNLKDLPLSLGFEDVGIAQNKNICKSRLDAKTESEVIKGIFRPIPLIAANMSTVINVPFYLKLWELGAMGIMHRAMSENDMLKIVFELAEKCPVVAMSIGVGEGQLELAKKLIRMGTNVITIDIAHGYCDEVINLAKDIKNFSPGTKVIVGNTTNPDMVYESRSYCDAIKVGIAQGFACETKNTAGCSEKQFSAVYNVSKIAKVYNIPIISDGGIREPADFVKAIGAGANSVMIGSLFAACPESAANIFVDKEDRNRPKKIYAGMASEYVQFKWKGGLKSGTCAEGGVRYLPLGSPVKDLIQTYQGALRSGITYGGGNDIKSFQENVRFVRFK